MARRINVGEKVIGSVGFGRWGNRQVAGRYGGKSKDGYYMIIESMQALSAIPCVTLHRFDDPFNRVTFELPQAYISECANGLYKGGVV